MEEAREMGEALPDQIEKSLETLVSRGSYFAGLVFLSVTRPGPLCEPALKKYLLYCSEGSRRDRSPPSA